MKPLIYYDFEEVSAKEVVINKKRLKEILEEVYQAGYTDGNNSKSYITTAPCATTPNVTYGNSNTD